MEGVKNALAAGADPNTRKAITLKVMLNPSGEEVEDTLPMESALTLAIQNGAMEPKAVEIVRVLLDGGEFCGSGREASSVATGMRHERWSVLIGCCDCLLCRR